MAVQLQGSVVADALWKRDPDLVPAEVHLITTVRGTERARLNLLSPATGWLERLRREYALPAIQFPAEGHRQGRCQSAANEDPTPG